MGIALTGSAVSVIYLLVSGAQANFSETVDARAFTQSLGANCVIVGVLLAAVAFTVARALRTRQPQA
jgi:hypothetical protein